MIEELKRVVTHFSQFPGIGKKTAERIAFFLLKMDEAKIRDLFSAIIAWRQSAKPCPFCFNVTSQGRCEICDDPKRDKKTICVVESSSDLYVIEKTRTYQGLYYVLGGVISEEGKENLRLKELKERVVKEKIEEVIIATNPTTEGELTASYLAKILRPLGVKVSRIARGLPFGSHLELADNVTITQALEGRKEI
uniref:Recombination protein RecR n=1 Tax=candidate division WOR-3 bacterium TaxID=2052148 RepID=A0A7C3YT76_UNCW3